MLTLFGDLESGNVHKAQMILRRVGQPYRRVDAAQSRSEPRNAKFLALNPMGKVPTLLLQNGDMLSESGAILYFFAESGGLWPRHRREQTEVLRWMFFEQYSHEPSLAVIRFLKHHDHSMEAIRRIEELEPKAQRALEVMEQQLQKQDWLAGAICTIADFALYPYTRVMEESGFDCDEFPGINSWLNRLEQEESVLEMGRDGAVESIAFADYAFEA